MKTEPTIESQIKHISFKIETQKENRRDVDSKLSRLINSLGYLREKREGIILHFDVVISEREKNEHQYEFKTQIENIDFQISTLASSVEDYTKVSNIMFQKLSRTESELNELRRLQNKDQ